MTNNTDIKTVISETVEQTVLKLKMTRLLKEDHANTVKKTEWVLKNYTQLKKAHSEDGTAAKFASIVENALKEIEDDEYYSIIPMSYFEGETRETLAEFFDTTVTTISRNKTRLLHKLATLIFADDVVKELFL